MILEGCIGIFTQGDEGEKQMVGRGTDDEVEWMFLSEGNIRICPKQKNNLTSLGIYNQCGEAEMQGIQRQIEQNWEIICMAKQAVLTFTSQSLESQTTFSFMRNENRLTRVSAGIPFRKPAKQQKESC